MTKIYLKMKTYEELQNEVNRLNIGLFVKDKEIERLKKSEKEALDTLESATYENINLINEVDRLNNIINELEKYLETEKDNHNCSWHYREWIRQVFEKLQELKGDSSNEC